MRAIFIFLLFFINTVAAEEIKYREPFTLNLPIDSQYYYQEAFEKIPYVYQNVVFLFVNENFGINISKNENSEVSYEKDIKKADIEFSLTQQSIEKNIVMIMVIKNNTNQTLYLEGLMTVPNKKSVMKTTILSVRPGMSNVESWPHPIIQIALRNIRLE